MKPSDLWEDAKEILGTCDQSKFFSKLTDAIQMLANKGNWDLLTNWVDICACNNSSTSITLPREIETPLAVNIDGRPAYFRNRWFEFHLNGLGSCVPVPWTWDDVGDVVTFYDLIQASNLVLVADLKTDKDLKVRVFGYDNNGVYVRTQERDGTWKDGIEIEARLLVDFAGGQIIPDTDRVFARDFTMHRLIELNSSTPHQLVTGEPVVLTALTAPLPTPFVSGTQYYVRYIDADTIALSTTQYGALSNTDIVVMTAAADTSEVTLTDSRSIKTLTQFNSATALGFQEGTIVVFTAATMPDPLLAGTQYFAHLIDANNFTVHETVDEAIANLNPIDVTTPGAAIVASARQPLAPITIMNFATAHNFLQGDAISVTNSTGDYPSPLLPGVTYYVRYLSSTSVSLHYTIADAASGTNPIVLTSSGTGTTSFVKTLPASATLGTANNITCVGHNLTVNTYPAAVASATRARNTDVATITTGSPHGLSSGDYVQITGMSDVTYNDSHAQVTVTGPSSFTYSNIGLNELVTADVAGTITIIPNKGDYVQFTTTGGYPDPITQGTVYRAEPPMSANTFTLYSTAPNVVDILTPGFGQLFVQLSRAIAIGFNEQWRTVAENLTTGDPVRFFTNGTLPGCAPAIDMVTTYYIRVIDTNTIEIYDTYAHSINVPATTGRITVTSVGSGDLYLVFDRTVTAVPASSLMALESSQYLQNGATVQFTTDGTLPAPLAASTDYLMQISGSLVQIQTMAGANITLTTIGSGNHEMVIERQVGVTLPTFVDVISNNYNDGDLITVSSDGTLPSPLVQNHSYYLRRLNDDEVELYDTYAHAVDIGFTTGRIVVSDTGSGEHIMYQIIPNVRFQRITRITKPVTDGFLALYAYDYGRNIPLTMIGYYFPDETEPNYRRIKVSRCCSWIRMRFKRRLFKISSMDDFIPLKSRMAVLMMLKAIKMMDMEFITKGEEYEKKAYEILKEEQISSAGPDVVSVQFNDAIWTNPDDQNMDTGAWND